MCYFNNDVIHHFESIISNFIFTFFVNFVIYIVRLLLSLLFQPEKRIIYIQTIFIIIRFEKFIIYGFIYYYLYFIKIFI